MTKMEENMLFVMNLLDKKNGVITTADIQEYGVSRKAIYELEKYEYLEKIELGVYRKKGKKNDDLYEIQAQFPPGIYSLETALYIHQLSDYIPEKWGMTFYTHSHAPTIAERNLHVRYTELYQNDVVEVKTQLGNPVKVYSIERTLAEILRGSYKIDSSIIEHAYLMAIEKKTIDVKKIYEYGKLFHASKKTISYLKKYFPEQLKKIQNESVGEKEIEKNN